MVIEIEIGINRFPDILIEIEIGKKLSETQSKSESESKTSFEIEIEIGIFRTYFDIDFDYCMVLSS
jgi:hypothetical protein